MGYGGTPHLTKLCLGVHDLINSPVKVVPLNPSVLTSSLPPPTPTPQVGNGGTPHLTKLCLGVHEFNWDVSGLAGLAGQLRELDLHDPFLK